VSIQIEQVERIAVLREALTLHCLISKLLVLECNHHGNECKLGILSEQIDNPLALLQFHLFNLALLLTVTFGALIRTTLDFAPLGFF